ncbi:MAG: hypothetical protein HOP23_10335 [Methylococcaceae bacterium]|nr:hypothetical protein [Methylococcaceae bacterium]
MPTMEATCRLFLCARCRKQVLICRHCDRGQIYCADGCAKIARSHSLREAGRRYQQSRQGRFKQAKRIRRFRLRKQNVTHQGSESVADNDLLPANSVKVGTPVVLSRQSRPADTRQCHFCGASCSEFVRYSFLHRRRVPTIIKIDRKGTKHDDSP